MREGGEEGVHGGGGAPGARRAGPGWAGLGWVGLGWVGAEPLRGSKLTARITIKQTPIANRKPRRNETNTQYQTKKCASA
jgi:hypothetical protein